MLKLKNPLLFWRKRQMGINFFNSDEEARRYSTCIEDVDWLFGSNPKGSNSGLPSSAITLCGGEAGVGKTRVWAAISHRMICQGWKVLYFSLETSESECGRLYFKDRNKKRKIFTDFFECSEENKIDNICKKIEIQKAHLVVIDSVNKIDCFNGGRSTDEIQDKLRETIKYIGSHVVFLAHLNQDKTIKGGTNLPHMGDIVLKICQNQNWPKCIDISIGKTRYGESGRSIIFRHIEDGVECITENWRKSPEDKGIYIKGSGLITPEMMEIANQIM